MHTSPHQFVFVFCVLHLSMFPYLNFVLYHYLCICNIFSCIPYLIYDILYPIILFYFCFRLPLNDPFHHTYVFLSPLNFCTLLYLFVCILYVLVFVCLFSYVYLNICIILCFVLGLFILHLLFWTVSHGCVFAFKNIKYPLLDMLWEAFMFLTIFHGSVRFESIV